MSTIPRQTNTSSITKPLTYPPLPSVTCPSSCSLVPFVDEHIAAAAGLFTSQYRAARMTEPVLPPCHEDPVIIRPRLRELANGHHGVAATQDGRLVGFLLGVAMPDFRGKPSVYVPEWAHAVSGRDRAAVYSAMYARQSARWVAEGYGTHLVTILANDGDVLSTWFWLGFGLFAIDAVRELDPVQTSASDVDLRQATPNDCASVQEMSQALDQHLTKAPVFLPARRPIQDLQVRHGLADPHRSTWLAVHCRRPIAYMSIGPANTDAAYVIGDPKTASITAAFTQPSERGRGVGTALLNRALDWARANGYERCAVDFEPENTPATRFWLRHFRPVCYSMIRHVVDGRITEPRYRSYLELRS